MGVSGGEEGAQARTLDHGRRHARTILCKRVENVLTSISAKYQGEACVGLSRRPNGAGHFVKTIHNGIEYADMQMIAEIYGILRDGLGLSSPKEIGGDIFGRMEQGAAGTPI